MPGQCSPSVSNNLQFTRLTGEVRENWEAIKRPLAVLHREKENRLLEQHG